MNVVRIAASLTAGAVLTVAAPAATLGAASPDDRLVGVGDSILTAVADAGLLPDGWFDYVPGRQPNAPGADGGQTTPQALQSALEHSAAGGAVLVQDGGSASVDLDPATDGAQTIGVTDVEWRTFIREVVALVPDDRRLIIVLPGYLGPMADEAARRSQIIREEILAQPDHALIDWNAAVQHDPALLNADQLHPSTLGQRWLADAIQEATL